MASFVPQESQQRKSKNSVRGTKKRQKCELIDTIPDTSYVMSAKIPCTAKRTTNVVRQEAQPVQTQPDAAIAHNTDYAAPCSAEFVGSMDEFEVRNDSLRPNIELLNQLPDQSESKPAANRVQILRHEIILPSKQTVVVSDVNNAEPAAIFQQPTSCGLTPVACQTVVANETPNDAFWAVIPLEQLTKLQETFQRCQQLLNEAQDGMKHFVSARVLDDLSMLPMKEQPKHSSNVDRHTLGVLTPHPSPYESFDERMQVPAKTPYYYMDHGAARPELASPTVNEPFINETKSVGTQTVTDELCKSSNHTVATQTTKCEPQNNIKWNRFWKNFVHSANNFFADDECASDGEYPHQPEIEFLCNMKAPSAEPAGHQWKQNIELADGQKITLEANLVDGDGDSAVADKSLQSQELDSDEENILMLDQLQQALATSKQTPKTTKTSFHMPTI